MDGPIRCGDPTNSQENLGNVGRPQVFQGKTAECGSPVWTHRPRLVEVSTQESSASDCVCCSNVFLTSSCIPSLSTLRSLSRHQNPPCILNSSHSSCLLLCGLLVCFTLLLCFVNPLNPLSPRYGSEDCHR